MRYRNRVIWLGLMAAILCVPGVTRAQPNNYEVPGQAAPNIPLPIGNSRMEGGGFYTTPAGRSDLIRRSREHHDGPYPAGQHALALAAVQLFALTANDAYRVLADSVFTVQARMLERAPLACPTLLHALALAQATPISVVVTGSGPLADALLTHARALPRPLTILPTARHEALPWPLLEARTDLPTQALVCVGTHCLLPAFTIAELDERLGAIA